jgi:16S rRNA (guanine527-N7)-methyltransferase
VISFEARLREILEQARASSSLGPGPIEQHVVHSNGFGSAAEQALGHPPRNFADLGTGGGIPGLVLAQRWPSAHAVFIEIRQRRAETLMRAVEDLGVDDRIEVLERRAEVVGAGEPYREHFDLVTARSFGPSALTAEVGAGLVDIGGVLIVSDPPTPAAGRWPTDGLAQLGFAPAQSVDVGSAHYSVMRKLESAPERFPRAGGGLAKRPLW